MLWNSYVLELLRFDTLTFSDVTLNDINVVWCYVLSQYRVNTQKSWQKKKKKKKYLYWDIHMGPKVTYNNLFAYLTNICPHPPKKKHAEHKLKELFATKWPQKSHLTIETLLFKIMNIHEIKNFMLGKVHFALTQSICSKCYSTLCVHKKLDWQRVTPLRRGR
jgi:hypothetical protein